MGVGADRPALAAKHHRDFGVGLPLDETVDHLHPGALEAARPEEILFLVEAGLQFDHRSDRLPRLRRRHQGVDNRRLLARAIQRLLDRNDARIFRRLAQERDYRVETFIRVVDDEVLRADGGENIAVMLEDALWKARRVRREFERGQIGFDQLREVRDPDQPTAFRGQRRIGAHALAHQLLDSLGCVVVKLEPDHPPAPPPLDRRTEVTHQILGLVVDFDIAVTKHPERAVGDLGEAGE